MTDTSTQAQKERLRIVLQVLKNIGNKQADVAAAIDLTPQDLTHLKGNSKNINITDGILDRLHKAFFVNPEYIRGTSDIMFDTTGLMISAFEKIVRDSSVVTDNDTEYLRVTMDENFYKILIEMSKLNVFGQNGIVDYEACIKEIRELHKTKPNYQDFVILPRSNHLEILETTERREQCLSEVWNTIGSSLGNKPELKINKK